MVSYPKLFFAVLFVLLLLALPDAACYAADTATSITDEQWQQLTKDEAFGYATEKELYPKQTAPKDNVLLTILAVIFSFFSSSLGKVLIWTMFFVVLGWILYKVLFSERLFSRTSRVVQDDAAPEYETEEDLLTTDWEQRMQQALKENNIPLAIKYSYLRLLQLLQQKEFISYRSDKTNRDYYYELPDNGQRKDFRSLSNTYEYVWYGQYPLSQQQYDEYMQTYQSLKKQVSGK